MIAQAKTKKKQQKQKKMDQFRVLTPRQEFLKIYLSLDLPTFATETHLAEGQRVAEQVSKVKVPMFREGTRKPTVSRTEGQLLVPLRTFINKKRIQVSTTVM